MRLTGARGLVTSSSEIARPDGSLSVADNVVIDFDNIIQPRRGFKEYSQQLSSVSKQTFTYKSKVLTHYGTKLAYDSSVAGTFTDFSGTFSELVQGLRIKALETNGNLYFTSSEGIKKLSVKTSSDFSTASVISAGAVKAIDLSARAVPDDAGFLPAQSKAGYRLVFGYKDANSNLLLGAPSSRVVVTNYSEDVNTSEVFTLNVVGYGTIVNSDYLLFNTLDTGYFIWFDKTGAGTAPVNADTLDRQGIEVDIQTAASNTDVAVRIANALGNISSIQVQLSGTEVEVTINNPGNVTDAAQGSVLTTEILVTKVIDGSVASGIPAKGSLSFTLPEEIDTTYFYQIYRTGTVSVSAGVELNDLDPGDEHYFIFESPITSSDISAGEITVEDNTPDTFRASGAPLNTNAITGQGITQANERPPIAQDLSLFRNSVFYANTKELHRLTFSMLSVDNFVSGSTKFYVGRGDQSTAYTFVGQAQVVDITPVKRTSTTSGSYITINSANNDREYYIWFDTGASVDPALSGKLGIRVPLEMYDDTAAGSQTALLDILANHVDFSAATNGGDVRITNNDAGAATAPTLSSPAPGWTFSVVTAGDGEDALIKDVLLSQSSSVGVAIDLTARSLVKVINQDLDSPVSATYLSGSEDLPGKIMLEAKTLADTDFYIAISDSLLSSEFSPELPTANVVTAINSTTNVFTTSGNHGFSAGDEVYTHDNVNGADTEITGVYKIATTPTATTFTLTGVDPTINQPTISGIVYKTTTASDNNECPNRVYYSKASQPEAVPLANYIDVGSKDKAILRVLALRDNLFVLKEDGIYIVTGASAPNFTVRLLDNSAILLAPDSAVVLNNLIYCLTTQGVVSISDSGVSIVSRPIEDEIKKVTTFNYSYKYTSFGVAYESDRAYLLWLPTNKTDTIATQCFRYNSITNTWTRWTKTNTCGVVNSLGDDRLYLGGGTRLFIEQERKDGERQDYADRDFTRTLGADAVDEKRFTISSAADIEVGDVITQEQYLTITKFNRMLKKLDRDAGTTDSDYFSTMGAIAGENMANALTALVTKLNADSGLTATFTAPSGINTITALKTDYNVLINELNDVGSGTSFKDYKTVTELIIYEVLVTNVPKNSNIITVNLATWFTQGSVQVYKAIKSEMQWASQHFGEPEKVKQIPDGTLIFDQTNFYGGVMAYSSDRSADFTEIAFTMDGPGFWAHYDWGSVPFGGLGNDKPVRTLIPQNKSRCRYLNVKFKHFNARECYKLIGISLEPREVSARGYR